MKTKILSLFFCVLAITSLHAQTSGTCGANLRWSFSYSDSILTITGKGDMTNWTSTTDVPWRYYRSMIKKISFPANMTSIGDYAFCNCSKLESIIIPDKVTTIGQAAFWCCSGVDSVIIPENVSSIKIQAFANGVKSVILNSNKFVSKDYETTSDNCRAIFGVQVRNYTFGPNITRIGKYAFSRCTNVDEIVIPDNIQTIGLYAFENCSIKSVIIGTGVSDCAYTFGGCSKLKTVEINSNNFFNKQVNIASIFGTQVEKFIIGDSVTSIGKLEGCAQLDTLGIGKNVTTIADIANCPSLTTLTIPENVVSIGGKDTFKGNTNLKSIVWNAKNVGTTMYSRSAPFYEIGAQIESFTIGDSVETIPNWLCMEMSNVTSISFPDNLKFIRDNAFYGCSGLTCPIIIPDSVTYLGNAFVGCSNIPSVIIGDGVTNIKEHTFSDCSSLSSITIGKNVSHIDGTAFYGCDGLKTVVWKALNCEDFIKNKSPFYYIGQLAKDILIATKITSFTFGDEVQSIPAYLCYMMELCEVTIPSSVTRIGLNAFYRNYLSSRCHCHITNFLGEVPNLASDIGWATQSMYCFCDRIYVPCGSLEYYREKIRHRNLEIIRNYPSQYALNLITNPEQGAIVSDVEPSVCDSIIEITAVPIEGYHFVQWNDSVTTNPRSVSLTQDTTFTAQFAINQYTITISSNPQQGTIDGENGTFNHGTKLTYKAIANEGYHFVQWSDGVKNNPRTIIITKDTTISAEFAINKYTLSVTCNGTQGQINGTNGVFEYGTMHSFEAIPNTGYHFIQWSDDITDNPRTIVLTQNCILSAKFAKNLYLVQFFGFNNVLLDSQSVEHGTAATAPNAPTVDHYNFVGWDKEFTSVTSDLNVFAIYQESNEGIEKVYMNTPPLKIVMDGQIFILRGNRTYTLTGQEVK